MEAIFHQYLIVLLVIFALLLFACLLRSIKGPRIADRIVSVNMIGTMVIVIISIASSMLHEDYLMDICLIYAMMSFLAVVVISKMYLGIYREKKEKADGALVGDKLDEIGTGTATEEDSAADENAAEVK